MRSSDNLLSTQKSKPEIDRHRIGRYQAEPVSARCDSGYHRPASGSDGGNERRFREEVALNQLKMPEGSSEDQTQEKLLEFLRNEWTLARTFLQTAAIDIQDEPADANMALSKSREALATIRRLALHLEDSTQLAEIETLASELEAEINSVAR